VILREILKKNFLKYRF